MTSNLIDTCRGGNSGGPPAGGVRRNPEFQVLWELFGTSSCSGLETVEEISSSVAPSHRTLPAAIDCVVLTSRCHHVHTSCKLVEKGTRHQPVPSASCSHQRSGGFVCFAFAGGTVHSNTQVVLSCTKGCLYVLGIFSAPWVALGAAPFPCTSCGDT